MNRKGIRLGGIFLALLFVSFSLFAFGVVPAPGIGEKHFLVKEFSPQGTVKGRAEIKVFFNREVVPAEKIGTNLSQEDTPFIFTPVISGNGKWIDAVTFVYYPKAGILANATSYTATARVGLRDTEGRILSGAQSFTFRTEPLSFLGAKQIDFDPNTEQTTFELEFSLPVSPARLRGYTDVTDVSNHPLDFQIKQGPVSKKIRINVRSSSAVKDMRIILAEGLPSESGPLGLEKTRTFPLKRSMIMEVQDSNAISNMINGEIYIETTAPVDFEKAASFVEITPKSAYTLEPRDRGFSLTGNFTPQDRVRVTLKKGFPSLGGKPLASEWSRAFIFPEKKPEVRFVAPGRIISPAALRIPLETVNVDTVQVMVWRLYENNIPVGMRSSWSDYPMDLSTMMANKEYRVKGGLNKTVRSALDLKPLIGDKKGVFLIIAQNIGNEWSESRQIVNVTDLGATVKIGPDSSMFWINSLKSGIPVSGAKATLWSWSNQPLAEGITDKKGLAVLSLKDSLDERPVLATIKKDGDVAFIRFESGLYNGKDAFDTTGEPWLYRGYSAFCYMPRDIFRPGENVPVRAVVRNVKNMAPEQFPVSLKIFQPTGKIWTTQTSKLSKEGVLSAIFMVPAGAPTGRWFAQLFVPGQDSPIGQKEFYVEEFTAPRLFVETEVKPKLLVGDRSAALSISSKYTFGSPASGLPWEVELSSIERQFTHKDWKGFKFVDVEIKFQAETEYIGSGKLDKNGKATVEVKGRDRSAPSMLDIALGTKVLEEGGRSAYKTSIVPWYPSNILLGIELPTETTAPNKSLMFRVAAVTPGGEAAKVSMLKYKVFRVIKQAVTYEKESGINSSIQEEFLPRGEGTIKLDSGRGSGRVNLTEGGKYLLRVEEPGSGSKSSAWIYVYDSDQTETAALPERVNIITDKEKYRVGEIAKVKISAPFTGRLLLNVETYRVVNREVYDLKKKQMELSVKVTEDMAPNGWLTAQVVRPAPNNREAARAYGTVPIMLDNSRSKVNVELKDPGRIVPGRNEFSLTVKDVNGRGLEAEVTVMLVDEAILGLTGYDTPNPWGFFSARRALGMDTFDLYDVLIAPESLSTPLLTAGGGEGADMIMKKSNLNPVQAKRFKMLSLIKNVRSGNDGVCNFSFVLPEFSGKARLMAVAVTGKTTGSSSRLIDINRDLVLEPSLPRILSPGDTFSSPCQIFNKGKKETGVTLNIETIGPVKIISPSEIKTSIKPGFAEVIPILFKATGIGKAKAVFSLRWSGGAQKNVIEIAVRPAAPKVTESWSGIIEPGKSAEINIPGGWLTGTLRGRIMLSAMPSVSLTELSRFLIIYPHGCLEQTVSSAWPLLLQPDLAKGADISLGDGNSVKASLLSRIQKIFGLQNYDGGFMRWQGESWSQPWDSIYGTHFLIEAKKAGVKVSEEGLKEALNYLRRQLSIEPSDPNNEDLWRQTLTRRAYTCYVLALAGDAPLGWMESLRDKKDLLDPSGRLFLASAYALSGQKKEAGQMVGKKLEAIKKIPGKNENYDSDLRNKAFYLLAQVHIDPRGADAVSAAASLLESIKKTEQYNTQEGAFALVALAKYFNTQPSHSDPSGKLLLNSKMVGQITDKARTVSSDISQVLKYKAENTGKARLFAAWTVEGVPIKKIKNRDNGIEVRQMILDRNRKEVGNKIERGAALITNITVKPKSGVLHGVVVIVPLAAGLEIENPRFAGNGEPLPPDVRVEERDDRLLLYIDRLDKPLTWRCSLRAVTEGTFIIPQISAECMYDPAISSLSGGGILEITRAN